MPIITYQETSVEIAEPQSVLDALEDAGFKIPFSCRAGLCHSCMMQSEEQPPAIAQDNLSDNQKAQHFFLACSCFPASDMKVNLIGDTEKIQGKVVDKKMLNHTVLALFIEVDCRWFPGQYLNVWFNETEGRSYSIASLCDNKKIIELHIKRHDQGLVSRWLHDEVKKYQSLTLSKPMGNCFYTDDHTDKSILMVATGTGLAPLYGVLKQALAKSHSAPIYLYSAAGDPEGLYYQNELKTLTEQHANFYYQPVVRRGGEADPILLQQDVVDVIEQKYTDLKGWKIFLCGNPEMIKQAQRHCFFQGATVADILVDAFS